MSDFKENMDLSIEIQKIMKEIKMLNSKLENIEKNQKQIDDKLNIIQKSITGIENDIYEDDYEFEIICPYCNTEFIADITSKSDIKCPECQNIIELDWNNEDATCGCSGSCSSCSSKCGDSWFQEFEEIDEEDDDE